MYGLLEWGDLDDACTPPEPVREGAAMACEFAAGGRAPAESDSGSGADGEEEEAGCIRITNASAAAEADFDAPSAFRSLSMACEVYIRRGRYPLRTADMPLHGDTDPCLDPFRISRPGVAEYAALQAPLSRDPAGGSADGTMPGHATITIREQEEEETGSSEAGMRKGGSRLCRGPGLPLTQTRALHIRRNTRPCCSSGAAGAGFLFLRPVAARGEERAGADPTRDLPPLPACRQSPQGGPEGGRRSG